jgi:hypothetical protein
MRSSHIRRSAVLATAVTFVLALLVASSASACAKPSGSHCYALTSWYMTNGEVVLGGTIQIDTLQSDVPLWYSGDFYTNDVGRL